MEALGLEDRVVIDCGPLMAEVDAGLVERILENLLANAARHAGAGVG